MVVYGMQPRIKISRWLSGKFCCACRLPGPESFYFGAGRCILAESLGISLSCLAKITGLITTVASLNFDMICPFFSFSLLLFFFLKITHSDE